MDTFKNWVKKKEKSPINPNGVEFAIKNRNHKGEITIVERLSDSKTFAKMPYRIKGTNDMFSISKFKEDCIYVEFNLIKTFEDANEMPEIIGEGICRISDIVLHDSHEVSVEFIWMYSKELSKDLKEYHNIDISEQIKNLRDEQRGIDRSIQ